MSACMRVYYFFHTYDGILSRLSNKFGIKWQHFIVDALASSNLFILLNAEIKQATVKDLV